MNETEQQQKTLAEQRPFNSSDKFVCVYWTIEILHKGIEAKHLILDFLINTKRSIWISPTKVTAFDECIFLLGMKNTLKNIDGFFPAIVNVTSIFS